MCLGGDLMVGDHLNGGRALGAAAMVFGGVGAKWGRDSRKEADPPHNQPFLTKPVAKPATAGPDTGIFRSTGIQPKHNRKCVL